MDLKKLELMMLLNKYNSYKVELDFKNQKLEYINGLFMSEVSSSINNIPEENKEENVTQEDTSNDSGVNEKINNESTNTNNESNTNSSEESKIEDDTINTQEKDDLPKDIKLIYRKLVMITHPDKIKMDDPLKTEKIQVYLNIQKSTSLNDKIINILYYASKYNIDIDIDNDYSQLIEYHLKNIELKLKNIEYATSWVWYHTSNRQLKTIMIERLRESLIKQKYHQK